MFIPSVCLWLTLPLLCPITLGYVNLPHTKKAGNTPDSTDILQFNHSISDLVAPPPLLKMVKRKGQQACGLTVLF
jgi:hypothetical protein